MVEERGQENGLGGGGAHFSGDIGGGGAWAGSGKRVKMKGCGGTCGAQRNLRRLSFVLDGNGRGRGLVFS